jgi:HTH-type transcriptional regulator/antitoxin HigA
MEETIMSELISTNTGGTARRKRAGKGSSYRLELWPLNTEEDYQRMAAVMDKLVLLENPTPAQAARRDIMFTLMEAYEAGHHKIDAADISPVEILKTLMEDRDMNASDLGRVLGNRALGSLILNGKRELSKTHIKKLAEWFGVTPALFI